MENQDNRIKHLENLIESNNSPSCVEYDGGGLVSSNFKERVEVGRDAQGKPIYKWACGATAAEKQMAIVRLLSGDGECCNTQASPLWEDYAWEWFKLYHAGKVRPKTRDKDEALLKKHVVPAFAGMRVRDIKPVNVQVQLNERKELSKAYLRDIMNLMSQIFEIAVEDGYTDKNPLKSPRVYNPSKVAQKERKALTFEEWQDIVENIPRLKNSSDRYFMALLMFTPMRPSEIYGLRWENVDFERRSIFIEQALTFSKGKAYLGEPKTAKSERAIPMDERLAELLCEGGKVGFVVSRIGRGHDGEMYTEQAAKRAWQRIKESIDVHGMTQYEGRHTYATFMSRANVPLKTAASIMGHADQRMIVRTYAHTDAGDINFVGETMSKVFAGGAAG